jgi:hypothetical protein
VYCTVRIIIIHGILLLYQHNYRSDWTCWPAALLPQEADPNQPAWPGIEFLAAVRHPKHAQVQTATLLMLPSADDAVAQHTAKQSPRPTALVLVAWHTRHVVWDCLDRVIANRRKVPVHSDASRLALVCNDDNRDNRRKATMARHHPPVYSLPIAFLCRHSPASDSNSSESSATI